jgi:hypothetical protein
METARLALLQGLGAFVTILITSNTPEQPFPARPPQLSEQKGFAEHLDGWRPSTGLAKTERGQ